MRKQGIWAVLVSVMMVLGFGVWAMAEEGVTDTEIHIGQWGSALAECRGFRPERKAGQDPHCEGMGLHRMEGGAPGGRKRAGARRGGL